MAIQVKEKQDVVMTTQTKVKDVMATNLINLPRGWVLTASNDVDIYPSCQLGELIKLADHFNWVIFPLTLWDWENTIHAFAKENLAYAWDIYHAQLRFQKIVGKDSITYMMAPRNFMSESKLAQNLAQNIEALNQIYFPPQQEEYKNMLFRNEPALRIAGQIINAKQAEETQKRAAEAEKMAKQFHLDPVIFSLNNKTSISAKDTKAECRIGCCFGEPIPDYLVNDLPTYGNNNGIGTIVFPFTPKYIRKIDEESIVDALVEKYTLCYNALWAQSIWDLSYDKIQNAIDKINESYPDVGIRLERAFRRTQAIERGARYKGIRYSQRPAHRKVDSKEGLKNLIMYFTESCFRTAFTDFKKLWEKKDFLECLKYISVFQKFEELYLHFPAIGSNLQKFITENSEFWDFYNCAK